MTVSNFDELKDNFFMNIKAIATMEKVRDDMILSQDQIAIKYIPVSNWTMATEGSKRIELIGQDNKQQMTATLAGTMTRNFLPMQLAYEGKAIHRFTFLKAGT